MACASLSVLAAFDGVGMDMDLDVDVDVDVSNWKGGVKPVGGGDGQNGSALS
jgi:hypothetical protein